jgi:hypothetical protein
MMNEFEVIQVIEDLRQRGITHYDMRPGNGCIWVSYDRVNSYYLFRNGQIAQIQFD